MRTVRSLLFAIAALAALLLPAGSASALSYPVTSSADTDGKGTLRGSIEEANARLGADSIPIEVTGTIELSSALPPIGDDVTITGPGADSLTVARDESAPPFRIFQFGTTSSTLSGVTVRDGVDPVGAGILNASGDLNLIRVVVTGNEAVSEGSGSRLATGGGVFSNGSLTLRESSVSGNAVTVAGGEENVAAGGGIEAEGSLLIERSTVSGNFVQALGEGGEKSEAVGGGIALANGVATIEESTISGNTAMSAEAAVSNLARGGGIQGNSLTIVTGSTIAGNTADIDDSGSVFRSVAGDNLAIPSSSLIRSSIVSDPRGEGESCANSLTSSGFNLDEDGSCEFGKATDLVDVIAGVDPLLKDNDGPTPTHALLENSPALDRGNSFGSTVDQRGLPRPSDLASISNAEGGDGSDIGAFELQAPPPAPVLVTPVASDAQAPNTRIVSGPPRNTYKRLAKFRFASTEPQSIFQCKVDKRRWRGCANPFKRKVGAGAKHVFKVRAIDRFGNVDPTPARFGWRVKKVSG